MNRLFVLAALLLLAVPAWADDVQPVPLEQAIREYTAISDSSSPIDASNHESWKLYVYYTLTPKNGYVTTPQNFMCGLVPRRNAKRHYYVIVSINRLSALMDTPPKPGDVIAVEGMIMNKFSDVRVDSGTRIGDFKSLFMYPQNAMAMPPEPTPTLMPTLNEQTMDSAVATHTALTIPAAPPTVIPTVSPVVPTVLPVVVVSPTPTPEPSSPRSYPTGH